MTPDLKLVYGHFCYFLVQDGYENHRKLFIEHSGSKETENYISVSSQEMPGGHYPAYFTQATSWPISLLGVLECAGHQCWRVTSNELIVTFSVGSNE
jgi:hypothetical protein